MASLADLVQLASQATGPVVVDKGKVSAGGVDPLGLRQINFGLMDMVLPGLNNVAARLRPFVLMTWAWRRVRYILDRDNRGGETDEVIRDFVDRVEAIYAWSQFLVDPSPGIPGGDALAALISGMGTSYNFGGPEWKARRNLRRSSTGLISPLNYGPGLRAMGWLLPTGAPGVFRHNEALDPALDSFESRMVHELEHPAFTQLGEVVVEREDVERWGRLWSLDDVTPIEQQLGFRVIGGDAADGVRRAGLMLVRAAASSLPDPGDANKVRRRMAAPANSWDPSPALAAMTEVWRRLQVRQVFRLALEGTLHWMIAQLAHGPRMTEPLASAFVKEVGDQQARTAEDWLGTPKSEDPIDHVVALQAGLARGGEAALAPAIHAALSFCLAEPKPRKEAFELPERLPLRRAHVEYREWHALLPHEFMGKVLEVWILAQHAYWCVTRALADARGRGKTLLRLRIVMDEGGWSLTPMPQPSPPVVTPDRLESAIGLLRECGQL